MKYSRTIVSALLALFLVACNEASIPADSAPKQAADTIYFGGDILTMKGDSPGYVEALVVKDGKILFTGPRDEAEHFRGDATRMNNLQGHTLLPGFIDAHGHAFVAGFQNRVANLMPPPDGLGKNIPTLIKLMKQWQAKNAQMVSDIGWIVGFGYDDAQLEEGRHPTAYDLDKISTTVPVMMVHQSGHLMTLNHKALDLIGYTADTKNPPGGVIRRESDDRTPNGVLEESAKFKAQIALFSRFDDAANDALALSGLEAYMRYGFTTAQEGKASTGNVAVWERLAKQGHLPIDIAVVPDIVSEQELLKELRFSQSYNNHYRIAGAKLTLDGSPQGFTAWFTKPYHRPAENQASDYSGYAAIAEQDKVNQLVLQAFENNWQLNVHCNGDAAADQLLNAIENANKKLGKADRRTVMVHAQTVRFDQLDRMKELGVIPSFFGLHTFYWGDWHVERTLGRERAYRISPAATALQKGMIFTQHHDAPIIIPNSMMIVHATVNRASRSGEIIGPDERISPYQALLSITRWAAYQYFEEGAKGSLEAGKLADFVILDRNPLKVDPVTIKDINVLETIKEGGSVYRLEASSDIKAVEMNTAADYLAEDLVIEHGDASNHVRLYRLDDSTGETITIIPSLGRGVEDYTEEYDSTLTARLVEAGYKVILIQPRGIGKSTGDLNATRVDMKMLADDIKATLDLMNIKRLHIAGHAFGNRLARVFATLYPDYVDSVILLASGGNFTMEPEAENCLRGSINITLSEDERLKNIHCAFFAEGNDASVWLQGWYPKLAAAQINAATTIDADFYKAAGGKNILLIQATEDFIAPPELAGKVLAAELGRQLTYIEVENAGHALTSERPEIVAKIMIEYLGGARPED